MRVKAWTTILVSFGAALLLASCGSGVDAGTDGEPEAAESTATTEAPDSELSGSMAFANFGGTTAENVNSIFLVPFSEETGVEVVNDTVDLGLVYTMVENGNVTWDLVQSDGYYAIQACEDGIFEPLSDEVIAAIEEAGLPESAYGECHIEPWAYSFVLGYNPEMIEETPDWADFFDPAIPGGRSMLSFSHLAQLEAALLATGVAPDQIYPIDLDTAISEIEKIGDNLVFTESLTDQIVHIISGRASMGVVTSSRAFEAVEAGENITFNWDDSLVIGDTYSVMKGAPNADAAMAVLVDLVEETDRLVDFAQATTYGPTGTVAQEALAERLPDCTDITTCESYLETAVVVSDEWWTENVEEVTDRMRELVGA